MPGYNDQKRIDNFNELHNKRAALNKKFPDPQIPNDAKKAFKLFVDYYAQLSLYGQQKLFFDTFTIEPSGFISK